jgi:mannose-6-phosphate isomerase-like protein (cupin superfamily)
MKFQHGKIADNEKTRGWITGNFFPSSELAHDDNVEIKVDYFTKSHCFTKHHHTIRKTWTIVIQGTMHLIIDDTKVTVNAGEYIIYPPGTTEEMTGTDPNTIAISIHTPSIPGQDKVDD